MTLSNKNAVKTYGLYKYIGGTMGTQGYKQASGKAFVFNIDGFEIVKSVFNSGSIKYSIVGKNITDPIFMNVLDLKKVAKINENLRLELLDTIMSSDLGRVKNIMTKNKKGFTYLMEGLMNKGTSKALAFASVLKDYYSNEFSHPVDTNAIIKIMIKFGYEFTNMKDANKLIK